MERKRKGRTVKLKKKKRADKIDETPKAIKPFNFLGCHLQKPASGTNWRGTCPFCESSKLFVNEENGLFDCKVCGVEGNTITLMTELINHLLKEDNSIEMKDLAENRGKVRIENEEFSHALPMKSLRAFKATWNSETGAYLIPCISRKKTVRNIRCYSNGQMRATAGIELQLGGLHLISKNTKKIWLCEGEWDAVWMHTLLQMVGRNDEAAVWVPGANCMKDSWVIELSGYHVVCAYDNDEAGKRGAEKVDRYMSGIVSELSFLNWPDGLPNKFDLRDFIVSGLARGDKPGKLMLQLEKLTSSRSKAGESEPEDKGTETATLQEVIAAFERNVLMDGQMRDALRVMLAVCVSNDIEGDPLWLYVVGPPGAGKTLMLSALQGSRRCRFVSTISAHSLVSGWQANGSRDPSLIPRLKGKTLVAKDWTEILSMPGPMQEEIFSTLRGAYDGFVQKPFGNGIVREYKGCYFSILAGVTNAIHGNNKASLGERFLKYQLVVKPETTNSVVMSAISNVGRERKIEEELKDVVSKFLRRKLRKLPKLPERMAERIIALVRIIAILRAQVERDFRGDKLQYRPVPEAGTRLAKQLAKLASLIAFVDGKHEVGEAQWPIIEKVAYSTAYGFHLDIISAIMEMGGSATRKQLSEETGIPISTMLMKIEDLMLLKAVVKMDGTSGPKGGRRSTEFAVTKQVADLWKKARGEEPCKRKMKRRRKKTR